MFVLLKRLSYLFLYLLLTLDATKTSLSVTGNNTQNTTINHYTQVLSKFEGESMIMNGWKYSIIT